MQILSRSLSDIRPYENNPRDNNQVAIDKVAQSIKQFGFKQPIVIDKQGVIIAGHTRFLAAQKLGLAEAPCVIADDLSDEQARAYRIADNRVAQESTWDRDLLNLEIKDLDSHGDLFNDLFVGFDPSELANILDPFMTDTNGDDDVPEVDETKEADSKLGEMYELGPHVLMCGDSTDDAQVKTLLGNVNADMCFTDPPYGVSYEGGHFHSGDINVKRKREKLANDGTQQIYTDVIPIICNNLDGPCYMWFASTGSEQMLKQIKENGVLSAIIVWHKTNATYASMNAQYKNRYEPCAYWKPKNSTLRWCGPSNECTIWEIKRDARNDMHPTQKPVALAERAISNHEVKTVMDLFGGSGSTLIACAKTKRICRMMEISPAYCDVIRKRWTSWAKENGQEIGSGGLE